MPTHMLTVPICRVHAFLLTAYLGCMQQNICEAQGLAAAVAPVGSLDLIFLSYIVGGYSCLQDLAGITRGHTPTPGADW